MYGSSNQNREWPLFRQLCLSKHCVAICKIIQLHAVSRLFLSQKALRSDLTSSIQSISIDLEIS